MLMEFFFSLFSNDHRRTTNNLLNNTSQTFYWPQFRFRWFEVFSIGVIHWKHFIKSQETLTLVLVDESTSLRKQLFTLTTLLLFSVLTLCFSWKRARKMENKALGVFMMSRKCGVNDYDAHKLPSETPHLPLKQMSLCLHNLPHMTWGRL